MEAEASGLLSHLLAQERSLSKRRVHLQDRIDFIRNGGSGSASATASEEHLARLVEREQELSQQRRLLHARIDELRERLAGS